METDDPFSAAEFELWSESYDHDVSTQDRFPFNGYVRVLDTVEQQAAAEAGMSVLDIGTGTGNLAARFAKRGCEVWCTDFSDAMLAQARRKLPDARFFLHDLRAPWPAELDWRFDRIVSAYVFHHFELDAKVRICRELISRRLAPGGKLIIGDLSFPSRDTMQAFASSVADVWEQEPYWLADAAMQALANSSLRPRYIQVSDCAGVYVIPG